MCLFRYGDHAPKSLVAKLFAVLWIMLGITVFTMYTATLTTALSANIADLQGTSVDGKVVSTSVVLCIYMNDELFT